MFVVIDKPKGMTSHDVVNVVRRITGEKKVGHAGTLDPNATGVLIVGVGRSDTKKLGEIAKNTDKEYVASVALGEERDTDDIEGKVVLKNEKIIPTKSEVEKVVSSFLGEIEQIPPAFSAVKQNGKKAYELARKGESVVLDNRKVVIHSANILSYSYPVLVIRFVVSSGTYIRALARDIGKGLGTYAYLSDLRRTRVGEFSIENAKTLEDFKKEME